ncbi:MAG: 6-phosphogluconolactonase [Myxococcaceae bacterium]|nr:6-phosphogluconolactonase [Myxococcaceae bacterium]
MSRPDIRVHADLEAVADAACEHVCNRAWACVQERGRFTLALSGGSTPRALYQRLARHPELPWDHIELCFGDERAVPPDDPSSNARMTAEALTQHSFVPAGRVHRIRGELPAAEAARDYEQTLRSVFGTSAGFPRFDLVLLGLGPDGHTASLFPHTAALAEDKAWVVANMGRNPAVERVTLTFPVLNAAAELLFLVAGADKNWALTQVLESDAAVSDIPARGIAPTNGSTTFLVDRAALGSLRTD